MPRDNIKTFAINSLTGETTMEIQHLDVNNVGPTAWDAMSPAEKRLANAKKKQVKEEKVVAKVAKQKAKVIAKATSTAIKAAPAKVVKKAPVDLTGKIELKSICQELKLDPKAARRTLRKSGLDFHEMRGRWVFTEKQAEKARAVLAK
jgi:hypothetical protein